MKARITAIHKEDVYYSNRKELIGRTGETINIYARSRPKGFYRGEFRLTTPHKKLGEELYFYAFQFEEIKPKK